MAQSKDDLTYHLHEGRQGKHIPGHNNYQSGKSPITVPPEKLEELFDKHHGTGEREGNKEVVDFGETIGKAKNPITGKMEDTSKGKIHYGGNREYHIVPHH